MLTIQEGANYAREMFVLGSYEDFNVSQIIEVLTLADDVYYNLEQQSFLEDEQYDALRQYAQRLAPADPYFTGVGSAVRGGKVDLPYQMGSLNQAYIGGDFDKWIDKYGLHSSSLVLSDKLDGASAMYIYDVDGKLQIAYSRGDGIQGADITRHARKIHNVPKQIANTTGAPVVIRGEHIISPAKFAEINTGKFSRGGRIYKNPRNMVSGLMNSSSNHDRVYDAIDLVVYEIVGSSLGKIEQLNRLIQYGFKVVRHGLVPADEVDEQYLTDWLNQTRKTSEYELDGIVIDIDDAATRKRLKTDDLNPEYSVKFKVADASNFARAECVNVEWNISKDGYYKPRVQIKPVNLVGVTITNLTGFNAQFIKDNSIGPGAILEITRSGDVIPFIQRVASPSPQGPMMPDDEDAVWTETGVDLVVADVANNATVKFERLVDFFSSIDVPHLGEGTLREMFDMGFETPESIIPLAADDISNLVRSKPIGAKIHKGLREKFTNIHLADLMGSHHAFGRGVGKRKMRKLYDAYKGNMEMLQTASAITAVEGFEEKTAKKIVAGYPAFQEFFTKIKDYITVAPYEEKKVGKLTGKSIVVTGFRDKTIDQQIEDAGGQVSSGVSKTTSLVIADDPRGSSTKLTKARALGIRIVTRDEFAVLLTTGLE